MYCVKCGTKLLPDAQFCTTCGDAITLVNEGNGSPRIPAEKNDELTQSHADRVPYQSWRIPIVLSSIALLAGIAYWFFVERNIIREPKYKVGDSWQFVISTKYYDKKIEDIVTRPIPGDKETPSDITFKVSYISQDGSLVTTTSNRTWKQDMIFQGLVMDANGRANVNEDNDRDERNLNFPIHPGKTWESRKEWTSGKHKTSIDRMYAVGNWEIVTVAAGTYRALPIKMAEKQRGYLSATGQEITSTDSTTISWFSPEVKSSVKSVNSNVIGTTTWELKSFSLN